MSRRALGWTVLAGILSMHLGLLARDILGQGGIPFGRLDLGFHAVVVLLALAGAEGLARHGETLNRVQLTGFGLAAGLVAANWAATLWLPAETEGPWPRLRRVADVPTGVMPGVSGRVVFTANSLGLRGREVDLDKPSLKVLAVGGSTTECLYLTDEDAWPAVLERYLERRLGADVFVGNAGKSGHFTLHHEYLLRHYTLIDRFDWIVLLIGTNDLAAHLWGTYRERATAVPSETFSRAPGAYYRRWPIVRLAKRGSAGPLRPDQLAQDPAGDWYRRRREFRKAMLACRPQNYPPPLWPASKEQYRKDLSRLVALGQQGGRKLLVLTQPSLYRPALVPELQDLLGSANEMGAYDVASLATLMGEMNQITLEVCRSGGAHCLDLAAALPKDTSVFYDDVHFNASGAGKVASIVVDYLIPAIRNDLAQSPARGNVF